MRAFVGCLVLSSLCAAAVAAPADEGRQGQKAAPKAPRFDAARFIKDFDKNSDGKLSKDEAPEALREHFAAIDTNKDGQLSQEELQRYADAVGQRRPRAVEMLYIVIDEPEDEVVSVQDLQQAYEMLRKLDKNNDGKIDAREFAAFRMQRSKQRIDTILKDLDKNGDGKLSKDEARGLLAEEFDQLDLNKDGFLDRQELEKAFAPPQKAGGTGDK